MRWCYLLFFCLSQSFAATGEFSLLLQGIQTRSSLHPRNVYLYLPHGYESRGNLRYPVLYMHDGQNLYDPARSTYGETWKVTETLNHLIAQKLIPPIIVVGIDNTSERMAEYTHDREASRPQGGKAHSYLEFITYDLKPYIDHVFATRPEASSTGIMGSSLGGLVSLYAGAMFSETFGLIGAMSPSVWWNNKSILSIILHSPKPERIYLDSGTGSGERPADAELAARVFTQSGGRNIMIEIQQGATHNEKYWALRLPKALRFLFARK